MFRIGHVASNWSLPWFCINYTSFRIKYIYFAIQDKHLANSLFYTCLRCAMLLADNLIDFTGKLCEAQNAVRIKQMGFIPSPGPQPQSRPYRFKSTR